MPPHIAHPLIAGLASAGLFLLAIMLGLGFFFLFLPTLPLLYLGLGKSPKLAFHGSLVASAVIAGTGNVIVAVMFLLFLAWPACYIASKSLLWRNNDAGEREWFSLGIIFLHITLYGIAIIALVVAYYMGESGGIEQALAQNMRKEFADVQAEYGEMLSAMAQKWAFVIFAITIWFWGIALYIHAWFAQRLLTHNHNALRPELGLLPFVMPAWLLSLMLIAALASLIGSPSVQLLGKTTFLSLLFPYFLSGCAYMHQVSLTWPNRKFFLFFVYLMIFALLWPALMLSGVGLWQHIKALSSRTPSTTR